MDTSLRLVRRIRREFPTGTAELLLAALHDLPEEVIGSQDPERVQAALVVTTNGDWRQFQEKLDLARLDWRDALMG